MTPQRQFRNLQRKLDDLGFITNIHRSKTNIKYEVHINGVIEKVYKRRQNAKLFIIKILDKHAKCNN